MGLTVGEFTTPEGLWEGLSQNVPAPRLSDRFQSAKVLETPDRAWIVFCRDRSRFARSSRLAIVAARHTSWRTLSFSFDADRAAAVVGTAPRMALAVTRRRPPVLLRMSRSHVPFLFMSRNRVTEDICGGYGFGDKRSGAFTWHRLRELGITQSRIHST